MAPVSAETPVPCWTYTLHLPRDPRAPRVARGTLRMVLPLYGMEHIADTAELLTSELVTNAVRHTRGPSAMRLRGEEGRLRIGVSDRDPVIPPPFDKPPALCAEPFASNMGEGGRGLALVRMCARDWGGFPLGDAALDVSGKFLWVELSVRPEDFDVAA